MLLNTRSVSAASLLALSLTCLSPTVFAQAAKPAPAKPVAVASAVSPGSDTFAARVMSPGVKGIQRKVLALYYPWYGTPEKTGRWVHQDGVDVTKKQMATHTHYPLTGPYDSTDTTVIDRHLKQAHEAGIDTFVCSWWEQDDLADKATQAVIERAPANGMTACVYMETLTKEHSIKSTVDDLSYILEKMGKQPGYLKVSGKPVIFLFQRVCVGMTMDEWTEVLEKLNQKFPAGYLLIGSGKAQSDVFFWDGLSDLDPTTLMMGRSLTDSVVIQSNAFRSQNLTAKRIGRIAVETVAPGVDNRRKTSLFDPRNMIYVDRQDGKLYSTLWARVVKDDPDWILISSFNQWHTGTEIEPSVELGDKYLTLTKTLATEFKAQPIKSASN